MLRISKLTDYAIVVCAAMARDPERIVSAADLAQETRLEPPTVAKVLKTLARTKVVMSYRGAAGGYRLRENPDQVTVATLVQAMEGPIGMTQCSVHEGLCATESFCSLRGHWQRISAAVERALSEVTLTELSLPPAGGALKPAISLVETR
ncbi:MAG: SUF system Fe-S cluster assembly regulator [Pseudomonadota bacterium]